MGLFRRGKPEQHRTTVAVGARYGEYVAVPVGEIEQLLDSSIPTIGAYAQEQVSWSRPDRAALTGGFAHHLGLDAATPPARQLFAYAREYGYASRRFEEQMLEHEDTHAPLLTYLLTLWAYADPSSTALALVQQTATGFAIRANTDATGTLSYLILPGVNSEVRARMQSKTISAALDVFGGKLVAPVTVKHMNQAWEHGFVERYAEMSMPAVSGLDYGAFSPKVPAADPASPPPGVRM